MPGWFLVTLIAFGWLALAAFLQPHSGRVRLAAISAAAGWAGLAGIEALWPAAGHWPWLGGIWLAWVGPIAALLGVYAVAAALFTGPQLPLERWLLDSDRWFVEATGLDRGLARAPRVLLEALELGYLLAYPLVPLGAALLALNGQWATLPAYWTVVVSSGVVCYAALPVLRTRPPRVLESAPAYGGRRVALQRVNVALLSRVSSQVNTLPSGHAATAVAILLMMASHSPASLASVAPIATAVVFATVTGRYHFAVDTALGALVGLTAWALAG